MTPGIFEKEGALRAMNEVNKENTPVIFALSNPIEKSECTLQQAVEATNGNVAFASGTQFSPTTFNNQVRFCDAHLQNVFELIVCYCLMQRFFSGFANNALVFPGVGLAVYATGCMKVTDEMFAQAAYGLANTVTSEDLEHNLLFPPISRLRRAALQVATQVSQEVRSLSSASRDVNDSSGAFGSGECAGLLTEQVRLVVCLKTNHSVP